MDGDYNLSGVDASEGGAPPVHDADAFPDTLPPDAFARQDAQTNEQFPDTISAEDFDKSSNTSTTLGAVARGVAEGAAPGIGGLGAGILAGSAMGSVVGPVGALAGGVAAGMGAGYLIQQGQDWVLDKLGLRDSGLMSRTQAATDEAQHPYAKFAGELAPAAALLRPGGSLPQRAIGAGIGGGVTAANELVQHGEVDPIKVAMGTAFGAAMPNVNRLGSKLEVGRGTEPGTQQPGQLPPDPRGPNRDFKGDGEVLPPDTAQVGYQNTGKYAKDIESAISQRDTFEQGDPAWKFWNDYLVELQSRADGKGGVDVDASLGPHSDDNPFTYEHADRANDVTTTAKGVAADNPPAPQIEGAGNPVGAPMSGRIAQRPSEAGRDYRKEAQSPGAEVATQESTALSQAPIHEDVAAALASEQPPKPQAQEPVAKPAPAPVAGEQAATPPARPEPDVTAAVTPQEQRVLDTARSHLQEAGMNEVLSRLDALPPKEAAVAATKLLTAMNSKSGEATGIGKTGEVRLASKRPELPTGVTARSKADAARKQGVLDSYEQAVAAFKAPENESNGALLTRVKQMVSKADELTGGQTYRPNTKPPAWQIVKAARNVLAKPTPKMIDEFRAKEAALAQGADAGTAKDFQDTRAIEAGIDKRAQIDEPSAEAMIHEHTLPDEPRPQHETFDNSDGGESQNYTTEHQALTTWLNGLTDAQHAKIVADNPDIVARVKGTQDPQELMWNLMDDLADYERSRATFEAAPGENMPVTKRTPVKTRDDLAATEPGKAANAGRVLDKNSPEFKRLAAQYAGGPQKKSTQYDLDHELAARREGAENPMERPVDGADESAGKFFSRFMRDESGAVPIPEWMKNFSKNFFHPRVDKAILDYGDQIGMRGVRMRNDITSAKREVLANARVALYPDGTLPTPTEFGKMYRAKEAGTLSALPAKQQNYWNTYVEPVVKKAEAAYDELRDLSVKHALPGWEDMPVRTTNGAGFKDFMFRRTKTEATDDSFEPITNKSSLTNWAPSAQERDWYVMQNVDTGDRRVYRVNEDGKVVFYKDHKPSKAKNVPDTFDPRQVGDEVMAGNARLKVDHATIDELMQHGNGEGGKPLKYSDNPVYVASDAYVGLKSALLRVKMLDSLLTDPTYQKLSTKSLKTANEQWGEGNHAQTILPQLKDRYMPKPLAWALDDLVKTGFNYNGNQMAEAASRFSQAMLKPFYFLGPEVHVFNEADKFLVGRGYDNLNLPATAKHFMAGLKSVRNQDAMQAEIIEAGGNPMFAHALTSRVMPQIAKIVGEDMATRPWKYDPINKVFGVDTKAVLSDMYRATNKFMWWQSDVLYSALYSENKAKLGGTVSDPVKQREINQKAVHETEKIIDSYVVPTTFGKSIGLEGSDAGRFLQKVLTDPITAVFGRFHYGLYKLGATILKNMFRYDSTPQQRVKGASQAAMLMVMANLVYPAITAGYAKLTGNPSSEFEKRGITKLATLPGEVFGKGSKDPADIARNVWTPAPLLDTTLSLARNKDFAGRKIFDNSGGNKRLPGQAAEFAAGQAVSPFAAASRGYEQGGGKFALQRFLESNVGLKTPSPAAEKYEASRERHQRIDARTRMKRPRGVIEDFGNWLGN